MPIIVETREDFDAAHGHRVYVHGRWLHEDGASQTTDFDLRWEPPTDDESLLKLKIEFLEGKIDYKVRLYNDARSGVNDRLNMLANKQVKFNLPPVTDGEIEALRQGAKEIEGLQDDLKALKAQLPTPPHVAIRQEQQRRLDDHVAKTRSKFNELPNF